MVGRTAGFTQWDPTVGSPGPGSETLLLRASEPPAGLTVPVSEKAAGLEEWTQG